MRSKYFLLSFLVPLIIRAIPEIVAIPWPIGYDTVTSYAPFIYDSQVYGFLPFLFYYIFSTHFPFLLFVFIGGLGVFGTDPILIMKFIAPVLSGFLGLSTFYFSAKYLDWNNNRSLVCAVLCTSYFLVLRITWDLFKNTLGLIFFFLAVSQTRNLGNRKKDFLFVFFSLLCLLSHEMISVVLLVVVFYLFLLELFSFRASDLLTGVKSYLDSKVKFLGHSDEADDSELPGTENRKGRKSEKLNRHTGDAKYKWHQRLFRAGFRPRVLAIYAFTAIFMVITLLYYGGYFHVEFPLDPLSRGQTSLFRNYVSWIFGSWTYFSVDALRGDIFLLFLIGFTPILPFAVLGFFRNDSLDAMTLLLLLGAFMPVVSPNFALVYWNRWMLMLTFPFVIYACNFLLPDNKDSPLIRRLKISRKTRRVVFVMVVPALFLLSAAYMVFPEEGAFIYFTEFNTQRFVPSTMQHNTLSLSQCPYVLLACEWLKWNMPPDACLVVHRSLYGWAKLNLPFRSAIFSFNSFISYNFYTKSFIDVGLVSELSKRVGYNSTYVLTLPPSNQLPNGDFELVLRLGLIEIYKSID